MEAVRQLAQERFQDWKFGIFVHWGLSAGFGDNHKLSIEQLQQRANQFDASTVKFDAAAWVQSFREAGARYFTLVSRHTADRCYCLFPSEVGDFHSQRDYVGELRQECRRQGLAFVVYVALADMRFRHWLQEGQGDWRGPAEQFSRTMRSLIAEYAAKYTPEGFWLDGWPSLKKLIIARGLDPDQIVDFATLLGHVRSKRPDILVGNKEVFPEHIDYHASELMFVDHFGNTLYGDQRPTEVCETLPGSVRWFSSFQDQTKALTEEDLQIQTTSFTKRLISAAGRGVNYLLNVGPLPNGELFRDDEEIIRGIGRWLGRNGEAIYGTRLGPLAPATWGYNVSKGNRIYLHIIDNRDIIQAKTLHRITAQPDAWQKTGMPSTKRLSLKGSIPKVHRVHLLDEAHAIPFRQDRNGLEIDCTSIAVDPVDTVLVLETSE